MPRGAHKKGHRTWPRLITTVFVKRCISDISLDKMAVSMKGFTSFGPLWALAWVGGIYFSGGELDEMSILQKWDKFSFFPRES